MAPSDDRSNRSSTDKDNENPFISFKRYADEQLSSILQGVLAFPSAFASSPPNESRWKAFDEEARRRSLERDARLEQQDRESWSGDAADVSPTSPNDEPHGFPSCLLIPFLHGVLNHLVDDDDIPAAFPVAYVALSPYSPLRLEEHERLGEYGMKWRYAFEDLMAVQNGLEMPSESERKSHYGPDSSGEWVRSMLDRGTLGRWMPTCSRQLDARQPENDADEDSDFTELDLYQSFLGAQSSSGTPNTAAESCSESSSAESVSRLLPKTPVAIISITDLLARAVSTARKAVENDNAGDYQEAYELYALSLGYLSTAARREASDEALKLIWTKTEDYLNRQSELRILMEEDDEADGWKLSAMRQTGKASDKHTFCATDSDQGKPSIITTVTNTEQRTLPDGTVHTRIVLKKSFADGNKECSETLHTRHGGSELENQAETMHVGGAKDELAMKAVQEKKDEKSKKGWFWS